MWLSMLSLNPFPGRISLFNVDWEGFPVFSVDIEPGPEEYHDPVSIALVSGWKSGGKEIVIVLYQTCLVTDYSK